MHTRSTQVARGPSEVRFNVKRSGNTYTNATLYNMARSKDSLVNILSVGQLCKDRIVIERAINETKAFEYHCKRCSLPKSTQIISCDELPHAQPSLDRICF